MNFNAVIGTIGVGIILIAYFLNNFSFIKRNGNLYFVLNIVGASIACYTSVCIDYIPFVILEGTWALISIMVYAFVIHARFVPSLRGKWVFNLMSMFAFMSILFTYYGVNFHLVGLHSYASGEAKSLSWIWYSLVAITLIGLVTYPNYRKHYKKKK